jgi:plastocyanin
MRLRSGSGALAVVCVALALGAGACGEDDTGDGAAGGSNGADGRGSGPAELEDVVELTGPEAAVEARDNTFDPENIQVAPGTRVVWTNHGRQDHDIVPAEGDEWGVGEENFAPDAVYEHTFEEPGTYRYYCSLHGTADAGMTGAVVVTEPDAAAPGSPGG